MTFSDLQGMQGALEGLRNPPPPFTAFRAGTEKYGFSRIWAYNATHIYLEEYDVEHVKINKINQKHSLIFDFFYLSGQRSHRLSLDHTREPWASKFALINLY